MPRSAWGQLYERLGRADEARQSYNRLLALWNDGDRDPIALEEARGGLAKLTTATSGS